MLRKSLFKKCQIFVLINREELRAHRSGALEPTEVSGSNHVTRIAVQRAICVRIHQNAHNRFLKGDQGSHRRPLIFENVNTNFS